MSIFGIQYSKGLLNNHCLQPNLCAPKQSATPQICKTKSTLLNDCDKKCCQLCGDKQCVAEKCKTNCDGDRQQSTETAIINGQRVLRPWLDKCSDPCRPPTPPPAPLPCCSHEKRKSKIVETRATDCKSVIVKLLVHGGPSQQLAMFIDLPKCEERCDEVAFNARSLTIGEGKCIQHCQVPCEFAQFQIDRKKGTPSGVHILICFVCDFAPTALLEREDACHCYLPFCLEFEVWRRKVEECCLDVETVVPPTETNCDECGIVVQ